MARPLRIEYPGAYYHVTNCGQSRRNIFIEDQGRQTFLDLLADMTRLWKVKIHAYCLMDNHYHLLLSTPMGALSRPMRHLDGIYTQKFNRVHHRAPERYIHRCLLWIHQRARRDQSSTTCTAASTPFSPRMRTYSF